MIKIIDSSEEKIVFELKASPRIANTIRRYAMSRVPVFAIDKVMIYENRTAYFDEYIAHRIGQVPLTTPSRGVKEEDVGFFLDIAGPNIVYSKDLNSSNEKVKPAIEDIPIVTLAEGQSLRLEGYVKKGRGRDHAKFQASIASYKENEDGSYTFFIEAIGHMSAKDVLKRALDEVISDLQSLEKSLVM